MNDLLPTSHANPFTDIATIVRAVIDYTNPKSGDGGSYLPPPRPHNDHVVSPFSGGVSIPGRGVISSDDQNNIAPTSQLFPPSDRPVVIPPAKDLVGIEPNPGPAVVVVGGKKKKNKNRKKKVVKPKKALSIKAGVPKAGKKSVPVAYSIHALGTAPSQRALSNGGRVIRYHEPVTDMAVGPAPPGGFDMLFAQLINPTNTNICPWLASQSRGYEFYRFNHCGFQFVPNVATTQAGTVYMAFDADVNDADPQDAKAMIFKRYSARERVWAGVTCTFPGSAARLAKPTKYTINEVGTNPDPNADFCKFFFACIGTNTASIPLGALSFYYEIELYQPSEIPPSIFSNAEMRSLTAPVAAATDATVFGATRASNSTSPAVTIAYSSLNQIAINNPGRYLVEAFYTGTGIVTAFVTYVLNASLQYVANPLASNFTTFCNDQPNLGTIGVTRFVVETTPSSGVSVSDPGTITVTLVAATTYTACYWMVTAIDKDVSEPKKFTPISIKPFAPSAEFEEKKSPYLRVVTE